MSSRARELTSVTMRSEQLLQMALSRGKHALLDESQAFLDATVHVINCSLSTFSFGV